ncbi:similar to Saccharomyces cerevisiae YMR067C UBX4 UBX (ubiquitin regulatory X) domain-containing protein that interacts with Cdc48p [Maudiozyma saulgeensis]|uniref:Similar to Saccharomyces cerevisiae YMR067C UBX4 UBX (Ubiquitin regulatory X) domain-containing protein that interacts with Cdc48p n=1 Tax=Maudiozyma saulgeensis TaxID=1789683 RepID=A0A1X7RBJ9_9SACH|nr:similar to Saccharomyces cerevisiae YMR067C UBX4 UBX (ubiquitin regulatory X) domain-containing protein that interacts with Cdc48p [Kazachstania saulgeensis]
MSSVNIVHNFKNFKVKVSTNDRLNDALEKSIIHFKLAKREETRFVLFHNKTPVALDLPWRFLNLPAGANLELLELGEVANSEKPQESTIIKIRFIVNQHYGSIMQESNTSDNITDVLQNVATLQKWDDQYLKSSRITLQIFSKMYTIEELTNRSFQSLGITNSLSVRVTLPIDETQTNELHSLPPEPVITQPVPTQIERTIVPEVEIPALPQHQPVAYIPSTTPIADQVSQVEAEDDFEMTVEQARRYQQILKKKTGNLGGPLMTKRMREEMEQNSKSHIVVSECLVRIKFPDLTYLEIRFSPTDTTSIIYEQVAESLLDEQILFELYHPHPQKYVENTTDKELVKDMHFGLKTVLLFKPESTNTNGPFLKSTLLKEATVLSTERSDKEIKQSSQSQQKSSQKDPVVKKTLNKVPKWLKLSKK